MFSLGNNLKIIKSKVFWFLNSLAFLFCCCNSPIYFSDRNQHAIPLFPMPVFYRYNFLIMNLQLTWCLILDTEMHLEIFETCFKTFLIFTPIIPDPLLRTTFTQKALGSIFNWTRFVDRIGTKIWNEMPLTLRNLSKHDFKRKLKRVLFNILSSEDSYLDLRNVIQKVKFS